MGNILLSEAGAQGGGSGSMIWMILIYVALFAVLYLVLIRPQSKKRKKEDKMRQSLQVGDDVTTIGGIMGKIISIKEETDSVVLETGVDRNRIRVKRWSIASCDTVHDDVE
jgi:preprotein translocase subunit YajC